MQTEIKPINEVCSEVTVVIDADKVDEAYKKYFQKKAQELEIPGFRKGKAPQNIIEKLHGASIKEDFEVKFAVDTLYQIIKDKNLNFLTSPQLKSLDWNIGSDMKLTVILEHIPEISWEQLENLEVPFIPQTLEDAVNYFISDLRWKQRTIQDVDTVEVDTTVESRFTFSWKGEDYNYNVTIYSQELEKKPELKELIGKKIGDKVSLTLPIEMLEEFLEDKKIDFEDETQMDVTIEIDAITKLIMPEIDDEFAKDMDFENLEEMKAKIGEELRDQVEHSNYEAQNNAIINALFKKKPFKIPPMTLKSIIDDYAASLQIDENHPLYNYYVNEAAHYLVRYLIMDSLKERIPIEVTEDMINEFIEHRAILANSSVVGYKETNEDYINSDGFRKDAHDYFLLRKIAETCTFIEPSGDTEYPAYELAQYEIEDEKEPEEKDYQDKPEEQEEPLEEDVKKEEQ
ncbi:MAG: Trigger factor [Candidatus Cloacimonetes bacterium ADurb.Bin211]|nr:MAG: Trigger factor [Candidatus Cloacimonetes bacterium ADurb.Bin211]